MRREFMKRYAPKGGNYGDKNDCRHCSTSGTAGNDCVPADQEQEKEREVNEFMKNQKGKETMNNRCPKCGRIIRKRETIYPDCLEAIGRIIQEEVFPDSEAIVIKPKSTAKRAVNSEELERLFLLGRRSPDDLALHDAPKHYGLKNSLDIDDDWEYDDELDDEFDDEDDWEDDYDDDEPTIAELLKNGVFIGLFVSGGKKKITIKVE